MVITWLLWLVVGCCPSGGDRLGKYVYYDLDGTLHTKGGCTAVLNFHGSKPVKVVETASLENINFNKICSQCVTEIQIDELKQIVSNK